MLWHSQQQSLVQVLGEIVPMTAFGPCKQLSTGAVAIHFDCTSVPFAMVRLRHSKTNPTGQCMVLSAVSLCQRVPSSVCPVPILLAPLRVGMAPLDAPCS